MLANASKARCGLFLTRIFLYLSASPSHWRELRLTRTFCGQFFFAVECTRSYYPWWDTHTVEAPWYHFRLAASQGPPLDTLFIALKAAEIIAFSSCYNVIDFLEHRARLWTLQLKMFLSNSYGYRGYIFLTAFLTAQKRTKLNLYAQLKENNNKISGFCFCKALLPSSCLYDTCVSVQIMQKLYLSTISDTCTSFFFSFIHFIWRGI